MIFWYSSGRFYIMRVIIYDSSICTSIFCRSPLSNLSSVIHSSGYLVTSSSFHLANLLRSLFLELPMVGSIFSESFIHACLESPYLLYFVFIYSTTSKQTITYCASISPLWAILLINFI